jgi:WD40 repeat protein
MLKLTGHRGSVRGVAFSPDGRHLASGAADRKVIVWDRLKGEIVHELKGHNAHVFSVAFSPDGGRLASGGSRPEGWRLNAVLLWDVASGAVEARLEWPVGMITSLAFSPSGTTLYAGTRVAGGGGSIGGGPAAYRALRRKAEWKPLAGEEDTFALALAADGEQVALGTADGAIVLNRQGKERMRVRQSARTWAVALSPDGAKLAASRGRALCQWAIPHPAGTTLLEGHDKEVRALTYSLDGRFLLSGGLDGQVVVWDARTGLERRRFDWGVGPVYALACAPDGMTLAAAGDGGVAVWDVDALDE